MPGTRLWITACLLLLALAGCRHALPEGGVVPVEAPSPREAGKVRVGEAYFDFTAPLLSGGELQLARLVGEHVVLLQFWGIRCAPCLQEFQLLERLSQQYGERGLQVVGVNTDALPAEHLNQALRARDIHTSYPLVLDPEFSASQHYTHWLVPVSVLIDREGVVRAVHTGYKPDLDATIEAEVVQVLED